MPIIGLICFESIAGTISDDSIIINGVPWYDQRDSIVSAHGANIIQANGRYYMFGEFKTDSANVFTGFSCYSSADLANWTFERIAMKQQPDGRMGPARIGERPKVIRSSSTGEYIMIMHSDDMRYKDPCTTYATSKEINGEYTFRGPLLYNGKPIRKWDIGTFTDSDGRSYLLVHHGAIYRFAEDCHTLDSCMCEGVKGVGESPAMLHRNGRYYWFSSHTTSWERNDNMYVTSRSLSGPWERHDNFAPIGSNTWNSQTTFILPVINGRDTTFMYMGDRWSFPRQRSAATYVWLPLQWNDDEPSLPVYWEIWSASVMAPVAPAMAPNKDFAWCAHASGEETTVPLHIADQGRIYLKGHTDDTGGYAELSITDSDGHTHVSTYVDFYSLNPADGLRYISPRLPKGEYTLRIKVSDMRSNWSDKKRNLYGSKGNTVHISEVGTI